jgi:RNA polymerase sigma-70 factor (ECF subfamily)
MEELVRRALAGDTRAFEDLVRETTGSVRTVVRSYVKDPEDASDVVQEVYLRAMQRLHTLDDPTRFRAWLYAIARHAGLDHLRYARRRPVADGAVFETTELADKQPDAADLAEVRELASNLHVGIGRLAPRDATLLAMVCNLGFTPTDVAAALGMSHTAAKVAIHRARQRLRNAMLLETTLDDAGVGVRNGCEPFELLVADGDLVAAAVHARGCAVCGKPRVATAAR